MRRRHDMPFGATLQDDGAVRFRLWAPSAKRVELKLNTGGPGQILPMAELGEGWFETVTRKAQPGSRYMYVIDGDLTVPDPASRDQGGDVHGWSIVVDPLEFEWRDVEWRGRPWHETVLYELHVGSFSRSGTYAGVAEHLDHLVELGITAVELLPLAEAPGRYNWGYDGVYLFAPDSTYGRPTDLKLLVEAAHRRGLMVFVDVVYNHFGPDGNYMPAYAAPFFTERHQTPWGAAINYDGNQSRVVRDFMIHNALYWFEEYNVDGLRLDAVHAIIDDSKPHILVELAETVRRTVTNRPVHLVLENDDNVAWLLDGKAPKNAQYDAQWNDDIHHAMHVVATGAKDGYYADYAADPVRYLGRALTQGFAYQGEPSEHRGGTKRGEYSADLPPTAFVSFLQNHDQVGNTAFGQRISQVAPAEAIRAMAAIYLLAPSPPLIFMGEEWAASTPFPFFCDFGPDLAEKVREGRRQEFARFEEFRDPAARERIPDPANAKTFASSRLLWSERTKAPYAEWLNLYRTLLSIRHRDITDRLRDAPANAGEFDAKDRTLHAKWRLGDGSRLHLFARLAPTSGEAPEMPSYSGRILFSTHSGQSPVTSKAALPPWSVTWFLAEAPAA